MSLKSKSEIYEGAPFSVVGFTVDYRDLTLTSMQDFELKPRKKELLQIYVPWIQGLNPKSVRNQK